MENEQQEIRQALESAGITLLQAVRLALDVVENCGSRRRGAVSMKQCRQVVELGCRQWRAQRRSVCFSKAAGSLLQAKAVRRKRTTQEIRGICSRLLKLEPGLAKHRVNSITPRYLGALLERHLPTVRQREKARVILHGLFTHCKRQGWMHGCENPAAALRYGTAVETEVRPLEWEGLRRLLRTARIPAHRACMPALGLMLWAGIRPAEVERLRWSDLNFEEGVVSVRPTHSKTGGCRHVHLCPALTAWLADAPQPQDADAPICPPNWQRRWKRLRAAARVVPWQQDVLRHTFASYHAKHFRDFPLLQMEMGHRSAELLRSRYLSMQGVTAAHARRFWSVPAA